MRPEVTAFEPLSTEPYPFNDLQLKWLEDLETNPPQDQGWLQTSKGFCCLGRLAVAGGAELHTLGGSHGGAFGLKYKTDHIAEQILGPLLTLDAGLRNHNGGFKKGIKFGGTFGDREYWSFVALNDKAGLTMEEIAAVARRDPWNVFKEPDGEEA